jgi:hypothetical protein
VQFYVGGVKDECILKVPQSIRRGQQLANKEPISVDTIKRMYSYLSRAEPNFDDAAPEDCAYVSFLLWGGKTGLDWSESKLKGLGLI